jgi:anti-anti-sigma factor
MEVPSSSGRQHATCDHQVLDSGILVYALAGDIDMGAVDVLAFAAPLDTVRAVVVDLADVTFFDSTALNALLKLRARAQERGIGVHLVAVPATTMRLLAITDVAPLFPAHPSRRGRGAARRHLTGPLGPL